VPLLLLLAAACISLQAAASVSVVMEDGVFVVRGWTPPAEPAGGWQSVFTVYAGTGDVPPLLGEYDVRSGFLQFHPRYPLSPGLRLRAVFRGSETSFEIPRAKLTPTTRVHRVYPTGQAVPENQLKFYIEFSAPMSQGHAWKHVRLLNSDGSAVELPFLELDQEMWDATSTRLTVLFDPGRIKRGVKPLEDIGPAIEAGRSYTLIVDREWPDASGAPLMAPHTKRFRVVEADRTPIDPARWRVSSIRASTREPLVVQFGEPLEAALATRLIWVDGVRGEVTLGAEEREWRFVPDQPWADRPHVLKVDTVLEDLAGNRVGRPFDVDVFERVSRRVEREILSLPINVRR
jgi:hypothetical protein